MIFHLAAFSWSIAQKMKLLTLPSHMSKAACKNVAKLPALKPFQGEPFPCFVFFVLFCL